MQTRYLCKQKLGRNIDLNSPVLFQDKLHWLKLFDYANNDLVIKCADKYRVREYLQECGMEHMLNELYQVLTSPKQIDLDKLPEKFVIKTNFSYGDATLCTDKNDIDIKLIKKKYNRLLRKRFGYGSCEPHYLKIPPNIIIEKYLEDDGNNRLNDYKLFCFNGVPEFILVVYERTDVSHKIQCYDCSWEKLHYRKSADTSFHINRPESLDEMIKAATILSKPFPFVRIDFYDIAGRAVFGEMTFTPSSCLCKDYTLESEMVLGNMLVIPDTTSLNSVTV